MQKTTFKTRLLALLTAAFMIVMCVPFAAFAADEGGTDVIPNEINVSFNCWDATVVSEGADQSGDHYATYKLKATSEFKSLPTLKDVPENKEFKGWFVDGTDVEVVDTTFSFDSLKAYAQNDSHAVSISAKLVDKEAEEINVSFNCWDATVVSEGADQSGDHYATYKLKATSEFKSLPTLKDVPENKEFKGWFVDGTDVEVVDTTFSFDSLKAYAQNDSHAVSISAKLVDKEPETAYNKISVSYLNAKGGSIVVAKTIAAGESVTAPTKDGDKNITGWTIGGKAYTGDWSYESLNALVTDDDINNLDKVAYVKATAVYEKESEPSRKYFNVTFTVDPEKGSFTEYGAGPVVFNDYEDAVGDQQFDIPAVTAKEGYKFVGWKGQGASEIAWDADAKTFGVSGLCFYQNGSNEGFASVEAVFEPTVKLTDIKVNFLKEDGKTVVSAAQYIAKDATLVLPYDVEGVIGWKLANNLTTYDVKTKFSFNDLAAFVGTNYAADGTANLTFYAQYKTEVELKNITIKYVEDKDGAQEDVAAPQNNFTAKDEFTILTDSLYNGKVPAGKKLIGWQYKNGGKTTNFVKGEHVKFDTLKALLNGNWDNEGNAWVTLTPVFQDVKSDNGTSSSTSSSSNTTNTSSSNTTNTSASQKQVVKAAAAPANTTKVLPKTGATNAAPLIGGSLAVVALLMGYGVYGLVLRKKD